MYLTLIGVLIVCLTLGLTHKEPARLTVEDFEEFSYDMYFKPPPQTIIIDNEFDCMPDKLKTCNMSNPVYDCAGCKNMSSRCVHFDTDRDYIDENGVKTSVPANSTPEEGYCLSVIDLAKDCNVWHGDWALTKARLEDHHVTLICICKNPGLIGNSTINGACNETVGICGGSIAGGIDKPVDQISCACDALSLPDATGGIPRCIDATVMDKNAVDIVETQLKLTNVKLTGKEHFNTTIGANYPGKYIRDPCAYCLLSGKPVNASIYFDEETTSYQCVARDNTCTPIRSSIEDRRLLGDVGPDAIIAVKWNSIFDYGTIHTADRNSLGVVIYKSENEDFWPFGDHTRIEMDAITHETLFPKHYLGADSYIWAFPHFDLFERMNIYIDPNPFFTRGSVFDWEINYLTPVGEADWVEQRYERRIEFHRKTKDLTQKTPFGHVHGRLPIEAYCTYSLFKTCSVFETIAKYNPLIEPNEKGVWKYNDRLWDDDGITRHYKIAFLKYTNLKYASGKLLFDVLPYKFNNVDTWLRWAGSQLKIVPPPTDKKKEDSIGTIITNDIGKVADFYRKIYFGKTPYEIAQEIEARLHKNESKSTENT